MASTTRSIGVIIGSTRQPRVCPQVASFVLQTIKLQAPVDSSVELKTVDLADWSLPFYDEPGIPKKITDYRNYAHNHTKKWSLEIQKHDAFIFVTPQYNWGYPAVLKNAIDFLFNEWSGKPALIVSYGGHGGNKCNSQLREVLSGLDMQVTKQSVELAFPSREALGLAVYGGDLKVDANSLTNPWKEEQKTIVTAYGQLIELLDSP